MAQPPNGLQGIERAAVVLMSLGEEYAAAIIKHMEPRDLYKISAAMIRLANIGREQVCQVLGEFNERMKGQTGLGVKNEDYIRAVLLRAFERDQANAILERTVNRGLIPSVETLKWMDADAVAAGLCQETPKTIAMVLSCLESGQAAEVLGLLPEGWRYEVLLGVATLDRVSLQTLAELNELVEERLISHIGAAINAKLGGPQRAAQLLNLLDDAIERPLLAKIKEIDPALAEEIEDRMLVFEKILEMDDSDIQSLLREISSRTLIVALRGSDARIRAKILGNMSRRAAERLREDLEVMPPVRHRDVEAARKEIMATAKRLLLAHRTKERFI